MFFLIDFSYKQGLGIYTRLLSSVIYVQARIQKFEIVTVLKYFRNAEVWIPACAGMTAEFSAKIAPPVFRRLFALSLLRFFCRRSDSRIRHFQQRFFGNDRRVKCFCRIQVFDLHFKFTSLPISQTWCLTLSRPVCRS